MRIFILTLLCGLLSGISNASLAASPTDEEWRPLYTLVDADLQARLQTAVDSRPEWKRLVRQKNLAIGVVDLNGAQPHFARVNGNQMMYAASLPKIAILLAAYASFEDGSVEETDAAHEDLVSMIRVSSNAAATRVIDLVGIDKIAEVLTDPRYELYDETRGGGLWVGKRYAKKGRRKGDPMHGISHGATVTQVCRFFYLLSQGRLVNEHRSKQMLSDLVDPKLNHKFVGALRDVAPNARIYRKSGTWRTWHSDAVYVRGTQWRNYILVAMSNTENGGDLLKAIVPVVEDFLEGRQDLPEDAGAL